MTGVNIDGKKAYSQLGSGPIISMLSVIIFLCVRVCMCGSFRSSICKYSFRHHGALQLMVHLLLLLLFKKERLVLTR